MDLGQDANFTFKHPYFFQSFVFNFEGLKPDIKAHFEKIVTNLGGIVSEQTEYVFTDIYYKPLDQKKKYYSLSFILDSILAEEPRRVEDYRLKNEEQITDQSTYCCMYARYTLNTESCMRYYNRYVCCELCMKPQIHELSQKSNNLCTDTQNEQISNSESNELLNITDDLPLVQNEINHLNLDGNSSDSIDHDGHSTASIQSQANVISEDNEIHSSGKDSSPNGIVERHFNFDLEKPGCSTQISKQLQTNQQSSIDRWKRIRKMSSSSESCKSLDVGSPVRKRKNKRQRLLPSPLPETGDNTSSSDSDYVAEESSSKSSSNDEQHFISFNLQSGNKKPWWLDLPTPTNSHLNNKTGIRAKIRGRGRDYSIVEKRIMIAYLVKNNKISDGTSRRPWMALLDEGYLPDRTSESLNNHYRRALLPNIEDFRLPKDIEDQFLYERKRHAISRDK